eukprot:m.719554 g.719554  ORF g.719554 m.719554 type:complete len:660 (-) comp58812_c0_seq10:1834-3813(-)
MYCTIRFPLLRVFRFSVLVAKHVNQNTKTGTLTSAALEMEALADGPAMTEPEEGLGVLLAEPTFAQFFNDFLARQDMAPRLQFISSHGFFLDLNAFTADDLEIVLAQIPPESTAPAAYQGVVEYLAETALVDFVGTRRFADYILVKSLCHFDMDYARASINEQRLRSVLDSKIGVDRFKAYVFQTLGRTQLLAWLDMAEASVLEPGSVRRGLLLRRIAHYSKPGSALFLGSEFVPIDLHVDLTGLGDLSELDPVRDALLSVLREYWVPRFLYHAQRMEGTSLGKTKRPITASWLARPPGATRANSAMPRSTLRPIREVHDERQPHELKQPVGVSDARKATRTSPLTSGGSRAGSIVKTKSAPHSLVLPPLDERGITSPRASSVGKLRFVSSKSVSLARLDRNTSMSLEGGNVSQEPPRTKIPQQLSQRQLQRFEKFLAEHSKGPQSPVYDPMLYLQPAEECSDVEDTQLRTRDKHRSRTVGSSIGMKLSPVKSVSVAEWPLQRQQISSRAVLPGIHARNLDSRAPSSFSRHSRPRTVDETQLDDETWLATELAQGCGYWRYLMELIELGDAKSSLVEVAARSFCHETASFISLSLLSRSILDSLISSFFATSFRRILHYCSTWSSTSLSSIRGPIRQILSGLLSRAWSDRPRSTFCQLI